VEIQQNRPHILELGQGYAIALHRRQLKFGRRFAFGQRAFSSGTCRYEERGEHYSEESKTSFEIVDVRYAKGEISKADREEIIQTLSA